MRKRKYCKYHMISLIWNPRYCIEIELERSACGFMGAWEGRSGEFGISRDKLLYMEWINNNVLI